MNETLESWNSEIKTNTSWSVRINYSEQSEDEDNISLKQNLATFYVFQNADNKNVLYNQRQESLFGQRIGSISDFEQGNNKKSNFRMDKFRYK